MITHQENNQNKPRGIVLKIMRMSTEDGPGIRTTVFFKGCPLKCTWCHNPEGISPTPQVQWIGSKCIGCKTCLEACQKVALSFTEDGVVINRQLCNGCGDCASDCPSTAMELLGQEWEVDDLVDEVEKDRAYFETSGGGITVSGGEPTMQAAFVSAFLKGCKERGIHTALDTCGQCSEEALHMILFHTDMVLFDLKESDPERHRAFTGNSNRKILESLIHLRDYIKAHGTPKELWIRTPIIPDATVRDDNIGDLGRFIDRNLADVVDRWELCSFNNLCRDKYARLGLSWPFKNHDLVARHTMEHLADVAGSSGVPPHIVHWSGTTRIDGEEA